MYQLDPEEAMIVSMVDDICEDVISKRADAIDRDDEFPEDIFKLFAEQGLFALSFDEEYGGIDVSIHCWVKCIERISRESSAVGLMLLITAIGSDPLATFGTPEQKAEVLPRLTAGEAKICFALTEPNAGSDTSAIATLAKKVDGGYLINGNKTFITNAAVADYFAVFAKVEQDGERKPSCFIVHKDTPGLTVGRHEDKLGLRGSVTSQVFFEDMFVDDSALIGEVGQGFEIAHHTLNRGRLAVAALATGVAAGALRFAVAYAKGRVQFGKPIAQFQAIRYMIADMEIGLESAYLLLDQASTAYMEQSKAMMKYASVAKVFCAELAVKATEDAVQIHGGYGLCREYSVERLYRDAKAFTIIEGSSQVQRRIIAGAVLKEFD